MAGRGDRKNLFVTRFLFLVNYLGSQLTQGRRG